MRLFRDARSIDNRGFRRFVDDDCGAAGAMEATRDVRNKPTRNKAMCALWLLVAPSAHRSPCRGGAGVLNGFVWFVRQIGFCSRSKTLEL